MIKTLPNNLRNAEIVLWYDKLQSICPETHEIDTYTLHIKYTPKDLLLEIISFRKYLEEWKHFEAYSETIFQKIEDKIIKTIDPTDLEIRLIDNSEGIQFQVVSL